MRRRRFLQILALVVAASTLPFGVAQAQNAVEVNSMEKARIDIVYPDWMDPETRDRYIAWQKEALPKSYPGVVFTLTEGPEIKVTVKGMKNAAEVQRLEEIELEQWCEERLPDED